MRGHRRWEEDGVSVSIIKDGVEVGPSHAEERPAHIRADTVRQSGGRDTRLDDEGSVGLGAYRPPTRIDLDGRGEVDRTLRRAGLRGDAGNGQVAVGAGGVGGGGDGVDAIDVAEARDYSTAGGEAVVAVQQELQIRRGREERGRRKDGKQKEQRQLSATRLNSSHQIISYAVFCLKKKKKKQKT